MVLCLMAKTFNVHKKDEQHNIMFIDSANSKKSIICISPYNSMVNNKNLNINKAKKCVHNCRK